MHSTPDQTAADRRTTLRLGRETTLAEIATGHFRDVRVTPLLADLNPAFHGRNVPAREPITLPSKSELARFAARMGFQVGFQPEKGGSTSAKKKWSAMKDGGARTTHVSASELARVLSQQGLPVDEAAKRLLALVDEADAIAFAHAHRSGELAAIAEATETHLARLDVRARLKRLADAATATSTPGARKVLLESAARDPDAVKTLLALCLVPDQDSASLVHVSRAAMQLVRRATELADVDAHARDVMIEGEGTRAMALRPLVDALVDGAPLCANERLAVLGVDRVFAAIEGHTSALASLLRRLVDELEHADARVVRALAAGDPTSLARPWPVAAALLARLGVRLDRVHAGQVERGIVALAFVDGAPIASPAKRIDTNPRLSVAELQARSAANARTADAHDGVPERLSSTVVALFDPLRPSTGDTGSDAIVQKRRHARFEKAVLVGRHGTTDGDVCAALVDEVLALARSHEDATVRRRAERVTVDAKRGALALAKRAR